MKALKTQSLNASFDPSSDPLTDTEYTLTYGRDSKGKLIATLTKAETVKEFTVRVYVPFKKGEDHMPLINSFTEEREDLEFEPDGFDSEGMILKLNEQVDRAEIRQFINEFQDTVHRWYHEAFDMKSATVSLSYKALTGYSAEARERNAQETDGEK